MRIHQSRELKLSSERGPQGNRVRAVSFSFIFTNPLLSLVAVVIVSGNDHRTSSRIFVGGTVVGIVTALDASARAAGFDELNVVVIAQANAALGISHPAYTSAGIVLAPCIVRVQLADLLWTDAPCDCKSGVGISHRGEVEGQSGG